MATLKYLDLDLQHITPEDESILVTMALNKVLPHPFTAHHYDTGFFMTAFNSDPADESERPTYLRELQTAGFSDLFLAVIKKAWAEEATLIRLDLDGDTDSSLMVRWTED